MAGSCALITNVVVDRRGKVRTADVDEWYQGVTDNIGLVLRMRYDDGQEKPWVADAAMQNQFDGNSASSDPDGTLDDRYHTYGEARHWAIECAEFWIEELSNFAGDMALHDNNPNYPAVIGELDCPVPVAEFNEFRSRGDKARDNVSARQGWHFIISNM
ncbi:MAG: hypothetical protein ACYDAZ_09230 [Thermoplasmataceae archaeon]